MGPGGPGKPREPVEAAESVKAVVEGSRIFRVGGHMLQEVVVEGQPVSRLRCLACGVEAPLTEAAKLKDAPCRREPAELVEEAKTPEKGVCEYCGGEAYAKYPVGGMEVWLCERCLDRYEEFHLRSRPSATWRDPITRRVIAFKVRHSMELMEEPPRIAWVQDLATWFIQDADGAWPCPACGEKFSRLAYAIKHFAERHPEKATWDREYVKGVGEVSRTWQGYVCPRCGLFETNAEILRAHYRRVHGGA